MESMRTHGLARTTVYENFFRVIRAINECPQLDIHCPTDERSLEIRASEFEKLSTNHIFQWCNGAVDGIAITIKTPRKNEVRNQNRFYSGNKKSHCLNLQVVQVITKAFF